ncbi:hypothetical protein PV10_06636 [Exophiala mesophila]|uniref:Alpha/beta hydrolase fold-3 domain-containing protein n=1 Tax=Exophiala mesophila TaxID=212818 RepID=A0A0D1XV82_EXOME|nr:uncharacterized protein PV10_06636 [Exophiala mesophila]KIV92176.1 hypothetical protein PV10_06636 [Exophiala mesophila]
MPITTVGVGAAVTPTVVKTYIAHYANRKPRHEKPTAHISYDEGLHLIRSFLQYASHHTVEDLQSFTAQWVPNPSWVRTENVAIPTEYITKAADILVQQLGKTGVHEVGGTKWWQWRLKDAPLKAEWVEMKAHYNEQKKKGGKSRRVIMYIHGGAYFFGSVDEHRYQLQRHARKLKARVFAPRYRLAPQFPFPCGLHDCLAAYLYLLSIHDPTEIIFTGDSAGGGMVVSILCMLRDRGLPLPAGAILISPWVDLTHSFPSLVEANDFDYIPPHGFMQKPSLSWPPPTNDERQAILNAAKGTQAKTRTKSAGSGEPPPESSGDQSGIPFPDSASPEIDGDKRDGTGPQFPLTVEIDGQHVTINDQIQMYTTNQLLAHPLVSPVLQPSLGGLPPLLILTGGGEVLRDEQIYLAHKAANPTRYPLGPAYRQTYDPDDHVLHKYRPTPVQLQVWEDLCHVAPTLSFTRPAKYMYRSVAQFGAWALARAQRRAIEIVDDDNISIISSRSVSEDDEAGARDSSNDSLARQKLDPAKSTGNVGRAGDAIPNFENNMIRQRIDRYGRVYPLAEPSDLPALRMNPDDVGTVKPGPVRNWLAAKMTWDSKYASARTKVQRERIRAFVNGEIRPFDKNEHPPPSALAGRRTDQDLYVRKKRKSYGLAMWSMWGSKHDEATLKREEEAVEQEKDQPSTIATLDAPSENTTGLLDGQHDIALPSTPYSPDRSRQSRSRGRGRSTSNRNRAASSSKSMPGGRRRTISVTDTGQTLGLAPSSPCHEAPIEENRESQAELATSSAKPGAVVPPMIVTDAPAEPSPVSPDPSLLSAGFIPRFKTASHLRDDSAGTHVLSDTASVMTGRSAVVPDDASTRAVFSVPGVISADNQVETGTSSEVTADSVRPGSPLAMETKSVLSEDFDESSHGRPGKHTGNDTPRSQMSLERLRGHQQDEGMGRLSPLRSPSTTAVMKMEGVVGIVDDEGQDVENDDVETPKAVSDSNIGILNQIPGGSSGTDTQERPTLYERSDSEFQTAMEKL